MSDAIARLNTALEGRYRLERELGEGGMATVYLADDLKHERKVAVKVLKPELAAVVGAERFLAEIKTTANLQHPNILPLFDSGAADGFVFYVMPYVEGESLRHRLDREKQLPVKDAVRIAERMAEALDYAHQHGVIHRDIKPANVLLQDGQPVIADFGIALAIQAGSGARLTETGLSLGTPHYMSPEQATGDQRVGPATDIYSLGCVLYETLAGEPPFTGSTAQAVLGKIVMGDVIPVTERRETVPLNVAETVRCALQKVPADRFGSGRGFAEALQDPSYRAPAAWTAAAPGRQWSIATAVLSVVVVGLLSYVALTTSRGEPPATVRRFLMSLEPVAALPVQFGGAVRISPDGSDVAYLATTDAGGRGVFLKEARSLTARHLPELRDPVQVVFSPDGTELAGVSVGGSGIRILSLVTGEVTVVTDSGVWAGDGDWSDDGYLYAQSDRATIVRYDATRGASAVPEDVTSLQAGEAEHLMPHALPGGRAVLFTVWRTAPEFEGARIAVTEVGSGEHRFITQGNRAIYSRTGHLVVLRSDGSVHAAPFDAERLELQGPLVQLLDGVTVGQFAAFDFSLAESGDLVYSGTGEGVSGSLRLVWVDRFGRTEAVDDDWLATFESVAIAPDGQAIAVTDGNQDPTTIWVKPSLTGPPNRLTFEEGVNRRPVWDRDGRTLLFISNRGGDREVWAKRADGMGDAVRVSGLPANVDEVTARTAAGWYAYRTGHSGSERDVYALRTGPDPVTLTVSALQGVDEFSPALSPNGRYLAYVSGEGGQDQVWVRPFPSLEGRWLVSAGEGIEPVWARDGSELYFRGGGSMIAAKVRTEPAFAVTSIDTLFAARQYVQTIVHPSYDVAPDGRFLMIWNGTPGEVTELIVVENFAEELKRLVPN